MNRRNVTKKTYKKYLVYLVILSIVFSFIINVNGYARPEIEDINFGSFKDYNALILGEHTANSADVEGRLAIRGNSDTSAGNNFTYAGAFSGAFNLIGETLVDISIPSILLGGKMLYNGPPVVEGGNVIISENVEDIIFNNEEKIIIEKTIILAEIDRLEKEARSIMGSLEKYYQFSDEEVEVYYKDDYSGLSFVKPSTNQNVIVSKNINNNEFTIKDVFLPEIEDNEQIIVYSNAEHIEFSKGSLFYGSAQIDTGAPNNEIMHFLSP